MSAIMSAVALTPEERDWLGSRIGCSVPSAFGFECSLATGHDGKHEAHVEVLAKVHEWDAW